MAAATEDICPGDGANERDCGAHAGAAEASGICPGCGLACEALVRECPQCGRVLNTSHADSGKSGEVGPIAFGFGAQASLHETQRPRKVPREDLLTPRDVARAFQLTFDPNNRLAPPPPAAPTSALWQLPSGASVEEWLAAVSSHGRQAARLCAIGLIVLMVTGAVVVFGVAAVRLGRGAVVSLAAHSNKAKPMQVAIARASDEPSENSTRRTVPLIMVPVPQPAVAVIKPAPKPVPAAEPIISDSADAGAGGSDDVRALWAAAMNAEAHKQFAVAVKLYDRIESLPSDCWPAGLQTRVSLARQEMAGGTW